MKWKDIPQAVGETLGTTPFFLITQEQVNAFADATRDQQWIHLDVERARATSFGSTIVHGYLLLSLVPMFLQQAVKIEDLGMVLNYGTNKVRFISPVPVGWRVSASVVLSSAERSPDGGLQVAYKVTLTVENRERPACVAEVLMRLYPAS